MRSKVKIENLNIKYVTMIYPVPGWSKIKQYNDKRAIQIANLVETTWLTRYARPSEITYEEGSELIGHELRK